jgi:hypothetical protein
MGRLKSKKLGANQDIQEMASALFSSSIVILLNTAECRHSHSAHKKKPGFLQVYQNYTGRSWAKN